MAAAAAVLIEPAATPVAAHGDAAAAEGGACRRAQLSPVPSYRNVGGGGRAAEGAGTCHGAAASAFVASALTAADAD